MQCRVVFAFEVVVVVSCIVVVVEVVAVVVVLPCREHPKLVRTLCAFAWHHNGVHFFNILTSKSAPGPPVVYTFGFDMCFAPQPRARALFFDISTSNSAPKLRFFDLEMCFAP